MQRKIPLDEKTTFKAKTVQEKMSKYFVFVYFPNKSFIMEAQHKILGVSDGHSEL